MKKEDKYMEILSFTKCDELRSTYPFIYYNPGDEIIMLDGDFSIEELEAFIFWMKKHQDKKS